ncbi:MAG TPA: nickel-dependent lactate racemase [Armatimonadota bacterium]|nr:nickel-dependent lactate racemase [Armatimonadota bacterium]
MRIAFPYYEDIPPLEVPDANLIGMYQPEKVGSVAATSELIAHAFENPIGSPPIRDLARGSKTALILTDDHTRKTPVRDVLSVLIPELAAAGISRDDIRILVALGTHRPMAEAEMSAKFGGDVLRNFQVANHEWQNSDRLVDYGTTGAGTPILVNRAVEAADFIFGVGQIVPHRIAGFSGGGKIVQPGICGAETTAETHWRSAMYPGSEILGVADNPVRLEIESVAEKVGLAAIANAVCDADGRLISMFVGDPVAAHRAGAELSRQVYGVRVPEAADILVIDSYPMDIDLWQGAKALYAGELAVKTDGVTILIAPCPEGVSRTHGLILEEGYRHSWETISLVESGRIRDKIVAAHLVRVGRVICDNGTGILVSRGICRAHAERLGFRYAATPQDALDMAFEIKGVDASVLVVRQGGSALPIQAQTFGKDS